MVTQNFPANLLVVNEFYLGDQRQFCKEILFISSVHLFCSSVFQKPIQRVRMMSAVLVSEKYMKIFFIYRLPVNAGGRLWLTSGWVVMCLMMAGCGRGDGVIFMPVTGSVVVAGKPLVSGQIHFAPDRSKGHSGPMATGVMQDDGSYSLRGPGRHRGLTPGPHVVYLSQPVSIPTMTEELIDGEIVMRLEQPVVTQSKIPKEFLAADRSPWRATVVADEENHFDFEIKR